MIYSRTAEDAGSVAVQNSTVFQGLNFTLKFNLTFYGDKPIPLMFP
jgi:hypothetical protein